MLHHIDVHVTSIDDTSRLFDAVAPAIGWTKRAQDPDFVSYWRDGVRPAVGFILDNRESSSAAMRVAFAVPKREQVDAAAEAARSQGARRIEGPAIHEEYGDYYAVFFEDRDGNRFEIVHDPDV